MCSVVMGRHVQSTGVQCGDVQQERACCSYCWTHCVKSVAGVVVGESHQNSSSGLNALPRGRVGRCAERWGGYAGEVGGCVGEVGGCAGEVGGFAGEVGGCVGEVGDCGRGERVCKRGGRLCKR